MRFSSRTARLRGRSRRNARVPNGSWYDVLHNCVVNGPTNLASYPVSLADVPLFVKLGTRDTETLLRAVAHNHQGATSSSPCGP